MNNLPQARDSAGISTQVELAKLLACEEGVHIHPSLISHYEAGRVMPPIKTCIAILNILRRRQVNYTIEELFDHVGNPHQTVAL